MNNKQVILEWNQKHVLKEGDQETANAIGTVLGVAAGTGGIVLRNKRQQILFDKIITKFPHASDMIAFLKTVGKYPQGLTEDTPDIVYAAWVKKNIVKEGKFFRIMAQVLMFGLVGGVYNAARYSAESGRSPEASIMANY